MKKITLDGIKEGIIFILQVGVLVVAIMVITGILSFVLSRCDSNDVVLTDTETTETGEYTYDDLYDAYATAWNEACDDVFYDHDSLYYYDNEYNYYDFYDQYESEPDFYESYPDTDYPYSSSDLDDAIDFGRASALEAIFYDNDCLFYGEEAYCLGDF